MGCRVVGVGVLCRDVGCIKVCKFWKCSCIGCWVCRSVGCM